jgi:hypothetical protein
VLAERGATDEAQALARSARATMQRLDARRALSWIGTGEA